MGNSELKGFRGCTISASGEWRGSEADNDILILWGTGARYSRYSTTLLNIWNNSIAVRVSGDTPADPSSKYVTVDYTHKMLNLFNYNISSFVCYALLILSYPNNSIYNKNSLHSNPTLWVTCIESWNIALLFFLASLCRYIDPSPLHVQYPSHTITHGDPNVNGQITHALSSPIFYICNLRSSEDVSERGLLPQYESFSFCSDTSWDV